MKDDTLGFLLSDISRLMRQEFQQRVAGCSLTLAQARTLVRVSRHEGIRQVDLAEMLEIQPIIGAALRPILPADTVLCTDGSSALAAAARNLGVEHHPINVSAGARVQGAWHVQNVNAFGSRLRQWMLRFKGVATRYLANYLGWFRALDRSPGFAPEPASLLASAVRV